MPTFSDYYDLAQRDLAKALVEHSPTGRINKAKTTMKEHVRDLPGFSYHIPEGAVPDMIQITDEETVQELSKNPDEYISLLPGVQEFVDKEFGAYYRTNKIDKAKASEFESDMRFHRWNDLIRSLLPTFFAALVTIPVLGILGSFFEKTPLYYFIVGALGILTPIWSPSVIQYIKYRKKYGKHEWMIPWGKESENQLVKVIAQCSLLRRVPAAAVIPTPEGSAATAQRRLSFLQAYGEFQIQKFSSVEQQILDKIDQLLSAQLKLSELKRVAGKSAANYTVLQNKLRDQVKSLRDLHQETETSRTALRKELDKFVCEEKHQLEVFKVTETIVALEEAKLFEDMTRQRIQDLKEQTVMYLSALNEVRTELDSPQAALELAAGSSTQL